MAASTDLVTAKKNLTGALGENMNLYLQLLKSWFKQKTSREDFDHEARKLLTMDSVHLHNQFMLAILAKCQSLGSTLIKQTTESSSSISLPQSPTKIKKLKPKKRSHPSSPKVTFNQRFVPVSPLVTAPQIPEFVPDRDEKGPGYASREIMLPDLGLVHCRLLVTAWEHGLEDIEDDTVTMLMKAIQVQLKNVISAVLARRRGYKVREKRFKFAYGTELPNPRLRNSLFLEDYSTQCESTSVTIKGHHMPAIKPTPEISCRNAAMETAAMNHPAEVKEKVNLIDLYYALQVHKSAIPSHTVYATNMERLINKIWHPSNEELEQETIYKRELKVKQDMQARQQLAAVSIRTT